MKSEIENSSQDRVFVFDTTLRDGEQAPGCHLGPEQKIEIARQLHRLRVDVIEAGFPVSSPAEFDAVRSIARDTGRAAEAPEIAALARCVPGDIDAVWNSIREADRPRIHVFLAASDIHLQHKLRLSRDAAIERAVEAVRYARRYVDNVQFSAEDASRADAAFLARLIQAVIAAGASTVNIPDTVGYSTPAEFSELISFLRRSVPNINAARISVHCHNDLGLAVANTLAAVTAGARQIEATINGIGERAGNCSLEEAVMAMATRADRFPAVPRIDTRQIGRTSRLVAESTGVVVAPNKAIVGENAFAHGSGIHQDGHLKHRATYEIMSPENVGWMGEPIVLTARSGRRALGMRLGKLGRALADEELDAVFARFKSLADAKRIVNDNDLLGLLSPAR